MLIVSLIGEPGELVAWPARRQDRRGTAAASWCRPALSQSGDRAAEAGAAGPRGARQHCQRADCRSHQRAARSGGGADRRSVGAQRIAGAVRPRHRRAATSCAAIWDCEGERHHGGGRGTACPAHAAYPTEHRKPDGGIAGQGAGRCGAERAACSARCRGTAALYPGRGATSIANRPPGAAQSAGCSAGDGIVGFCWRITWTWMESRAASAGQCHEGRCGNADVAASGQAGRPSQRRQRDVRHRLRRAAVFRRR